MRIGIQRALGCALASWWAAGCGQADPSELIATTALLEEEQAPLELPDAEHPQVINDPFEDPDGNVYPVCPGRLDQVPEPIPDPPRPPPPPSSGPPEQPEPPPEPPPASRCDCFYWDVFDENTGVQTVLWHLGEWKVCPQSRDCVQPAPAITTQFTTCEPQDPDPLPRLANLECRLAMEPVPGAGDDDDEGVQEAPPWQYVDPPRCEIREAASWPIRSACPHGRNVDCPPGGEEEHRYHEDKPDSCYVCQHLSGLYEQTNDDGDPLYGWRIECDGEREYKTQTFAWACAKEQHEETTPAVAAQIGMTHNDFCTDTNPGEEPPDCRGTCELFWTNPQTDCEIFAAASTTCWYEQPPDDVIPARPGGADPGGDPAGDPGGDPAGDPGGGF